MRSRAVAYAGLMGSLGLLLAACASGPAFIAKDAPASSDLRSVLVLPANFDSSPGPLLTHGAELVESELRDYLVDRGYEVRSLRLSSVLAHWSAGVDDVGGTISDEDAKLSPSLYDAARREVARRALADDPADAVVMPTLLVRTGRVYGPHLHWDGVVREIPIDLKNTNVGITGMSGKAPGTSLRVSVYDARAVKIFERIVGLEPINMIEGMSQTRYRWDVRDDLFRDGPLLREGIVTSFEPWLAGPDPASE
jgi:hypothetical protein